MTAVTGILAFVLGEQFSVQRPGQVAGREGEGDEEQRELDLRAREGVPAIPDHAQPEQDPLQPGKAEIVALAPQLAQQPPQHQPQRLGEVHRRGQLVRIGCQAHVVGPVQEYR